MSFPIFFEKKTECLRYPKYLKEFSNIDLIIDIKKSIHNKIYSTQFKSTNYAMIYNFKSELSDIFIDYIISECDKLIKKKKSWMTGIKYKSFVYLSQLKTIDAIINSYIYNVGIKTIEKKYELPKWSLNISELLILNITNNNNNIALKNDFNYCISLKKSIITIDNKEIILEIGDVLLLCGKHIFTSSETYLLVCGVNMFGGYESKYDHNVHPNMIELDKIKQIKESSSIIDNLPLATEKEPLATEKEPLATEKEPLATEKEPLATEKEP